MTQETLIALHSVYFNTNKILKSCREARNKCPKDTPRYYMLCGKVKAYTDVLSNMINYWKQKGEPDLRTKLENFN